MQTQMMSFIWKLRTFKIQFLVTLFLTFTSKFLEEEETKLFNKFNFHLWYKFSHNNLMVKLNKLTWWEMPQRNTFFTLLMTWIIQIILKLKLQSEIILSGRSMKSNLCSVLPILSILLLSSRILWLNRMLKSQTLDWPQNNFNK